MPAEYKTPILALMEEVIDGGVQSHIIWVSRRAGTTFAFARVIDTLDGATLKREIVNDGRIDTLELGDGRKIVVVRGDAAVQDRAWADNEWFTVHDIRSSDGI